MRLESQLEADCRNAVVAMGGLFIKLRGNQGIPDRLIILPGGIVWFVELKQHKSASVTQGQKHWAALLRRLGVRYLRTASYDEFMATVLDEHGRQVT